MKKGKILIIDDNEELLIAFRMLLKPHFTNIKTLKNPNQLISTIKKEYFDIILLDMNFKAGINTGNEGLYWLTEILKVDSLASVILITAFGDTEIAVNAMKRGAVDFIEKSWDENKILSTLKSAFQLRESKNEIKNLKQKQKHLTDSLKNNNDFVGTKSSSMQKIHKTIEKVAITDANVLILGENGTGKEVIAQRIHNESNRRNQIFVKVDLGSITESLFESELFGHKKGAYTDAKEDRVGRMEIASGGTLFLDEIGNIPLHLQVKLLSAIQNREIIPLGANRPVPIDIRLICATNMDLNTMVENKLFREDLLYRINTIQLNLPNLRDRIEDIPILANHFLKEFEEKYQKKNLSFSESAILKLQQNKWKGNIRELQHVIEKTVILSDSDIITDGDFNFNPSTLNIDNNNLNLSDNEKLIISKALEKYNRNMSQAAKKLGINRSTLYDKIKKYDL